MQDIKNDFGEIPVKLLLVSGSPRKKSNSDLLLNEALIGAQAAGPTEVRSFQFSQKRVFPAESEAEEAKRDDFDELLEKWRWADAVIWAMPVYTAAGPGLVYNALDRLAQALRPGLKNAGYRKAAGLIMQGSETWGLLELGLENAIDVFASLHCIPVSRLAGQVPDQQQPPESLLERSRALGGEVAEIAGLLRLAYGKPPADDANVVILNAGVENAGIGVQIEERLTARLSGIPGIHVSSFSFSGKKIEGCHHCNSYCGKYLECAYKDGFQEFRRKWLEADGLIWISSANHLGPPVVVRRALDRLSEIGFSTVKHRHLAESAPFAFAKYTRPEASISYGDTRYGGQEQSLQFFITHAVLRGNLPITGSDPQSPLGPAEFLRAVSQLGSNQWFTQAVDSLADDVADLARRVLTAKREAYPGLPDRYYPSRTNMGITDKEAFFNGR